MGNPPIAASSKAQIAKPIAAPSAEAALATVDLFETPTCKHVAVPKQEVAAANAALSVTTTCKLRVAPT